MARRLIESVYKYSLDTKRLVNPVKSIPELWLVSRFFQNVWWG